MYVFKPVALLAVLALVVTISLTACQKEGPMERAGKKVDNADEKAGDKIDKATNK